MPEPMRRAGVAELRAALDGDDPPLLIDVRSLMEYRGGHVPQAVHVGAVDVDTLDPERPVWLICRSGARSARAAEQLTARGFATVVNVEGGTTAWRAAGEPIAGKSGPGLLVPAVIAATVGMAPFSPEPHVVGKLRWVFGGAEGMTAVDWFDLAMHGAPWIWLAWALVARIRAHLAG